MYWEPRVRSVEQEKKEGKCKERKKDRQTDREQK